jgi:hypothetical protein
MFVNISPADYNAEETATSLQYAARVKLITNDASKQVVIGTYVCMCVYICVCVSMYACIYIYIYIYIHIYI